MTDANDTPKGTGRRWPKVLLGVSLALNLLVLGVVGGAMLRFGGTHGDRPPPRSVGATLFRELPREDRRALWAGSGKSHNDRRARQKEEAAAVSAALRATPFDRAALEAVLDAQSAHQVTFQETVQQAWLTRISGMNDADRLAYADRLERTLSARHSDRKRKDRRHD